MLGGWRTRASPERAAFIVHRQALACWEREATVVAPPPVCDLAVAPCFHGSPVFLCSIPCYRFLPHVPSVSFPTASSSSYSRPVLQSPRSSSQPPCTPVNTQPSPGHVVHGMDHLRISHSVPPATDWPLHPLLRASNASLLFQSISPSERDFPEFGNLSSASAPPSQGAGPIPLPLLLLLPSFFSILPSYAGIFRVLSGVQDLLLVFSRCSVRTVASVDVFLCICGER